METELKCCMFTCSIVKNGLFSKDLVVAADVSLLNLPTRFLHRVNIQCIEIIFKISLTTHYFCSCT